MHVGLSVRSCARLIAAERGSELLTGIAVTTGVAGWPSFAMRARSFNVSFAVARVADLARDLACPLVLPCWVVTTAFDRICFAAVSSSSSARSLVRIESSGPPVTPHLTRLDSSMNGVGARRSDDTGSCNAFKYFRHYHGNTGSCHTCIKNRGWLRL